MKSHNSHMTSPLCLICQMYEWCLLLCWPHLRRLHWPSVDSSQKGSVTRGFNGFFYVCWMIGWTKSWVNDIINNHRKSNIQCKFKLNNGTVTDDKKVISESFKKFFINIGPTLAKSIPFIDKSPLNSMGDRILESLYLQPVTCEEINNILVSLKNTACGWDDISSVFLKLSTQQILKPLSHICNLSLTAGAFPNQLKMANVIPLYKSEDPMLFNHYRPVSLLCVLSKVFEKIMHTRLLDF